MNIGTMFELSISHLISQSFSKFKPCFRGAKNISRSGNLVNGENILSSHLQNVFAGHDVDLCLFVPCFPAFFDLLISLGQ